MDHTESQNHCLLQRGMQMVSNFSSLGYLCEIYNLRSYFNALQSHQYERIKSRGLNRQNLLSDRVQQQQIFFVPNNHCAQDVPLLCCVTRPHTLAITSCKENSTAPYNRPREKNSFLPFWLFGKTDHTTGIFFIRPTRILTRQQV